MENIGYRYNRFIIFLLVISPFLSFFVFTYIDTPLSFMGLMQLLSFIGVILIFVFKDKKQPIIIPKYLIFYFLFILYVFYSAFIQLERDFKIIYLFSNPLIGAFFFMLIIENLPISKKYYRYIFRLSKYILIIAFVVIIVQQVYDQDFYMNNNEKLDHSFLSGVNKIRLKSIYSYLTFLSFGLSYLPILIWVVESLYKKKKKVLIWLFMAIIYAFLSKARWLMLNTSLVFVIILIHNKYKIKQIVKLSLLIPIFAFITYKSLNSIGVNVDKIMTKRILESDKSEGHKSASTRILAIKVFKKLYLNNPVFGHGSIKYGMGGTGKQDYQLRSALGGHSSQIHIGYLSLFYMYGLIGGFLFLTFLYLLLKKMYKDAKTTGVWAPFLSILGVAMANLTLVTFSFFEMGLIIVLMVNKYNLQDKVVKKSLYV